MPFQVYSLYNIKPRRDYAINWFFVNPVLRKGEITLEIQPDGKYLYKIGDGNTKYRNLPYRTQIPWDFFKEKSMRKIGKQKDLIKLVEGNIPKTLGILTIWYEKQESKLFEKMLSGERSVIESDEVALYVESEFTRINDRLNELGCSGNVEVSYKQFITTDSYLKLKSIYEKYEELKEKLIHSIIEILAILSSCEDYDQEMKILFSYGIVDDDGKLMHPEREEAAV